MRKGKVKIALIMIKKALNFPDNWEIEKVEMSDNGQVLNMIISGDDFPEVIPIKECNIIIHKECTKIEVEERK